MSHDITIREDGTAEVFTGSNQKPWHNLGVTVEGLATAKEAIELAKLNWEVEQRQVYTDLDDSADKQEIEGFFANVRKDNQLALAVVKERYNIIQNEEAFDFFDSIVGEGKAVYDTAGSLRGGKVVWIMAKLNGTMFVENNPNDVSEKNVLLVTSHDGSHALSVQFVATRVVCQNTLSVALKGKKNCTKIRHTRNYKDKSKIAQKALGLAEAYFDDLQGLMNTLSNTKMESSEMRKFTEQLFPTEDENDVPTRTENIRNEVFNLFRNGKGNFGETRFDALNAVTEYVDYVRGTRGEETTRFETSLLGSGARIKERAVALLV